MKTLTALISNGDQFENIARMLQAALQRPRNAIQSLERLLSSKLLTTSSRPIESEIEYR